MRAGSETPGAVTLCRVCPREMQSWQTTQESSEPNVHNESWSQTHKRRAAYLLHEMRKRMTVMLQGTAAYYFR